MEQSVDRYNDDRKLQDFQIYSSYGFDDNDIRALRKQDFVEDLFASKMVDVLSENEYGDVLVTRVEEVNRPMNDFQLISSLFPIHKSIFMNQLPTYVNDIVVFIHNPPGCSNRVIKLNSQR
ncbi:MAG: hypothetical protein IKH73_06030, partial [Erysipelotrichaceae bacterium]|nr:hypothetical protein [Erysipelotrichaceae bacterium]